MWNERPEKVVDVGTAPRVQAPGLLLAGVLTPDTANAKIQAPGLLLAGVLAPDTANAKSPGSGPTAGRSSCSRHRQCQESRLRAYCSHECRVRAYCHQKSRVQAYCHQEPRLQAYLPPGFPTLATAIPDPLPSSGLEDE
eukprot:g28043.t1